MTELKKLGKYEIRGELGQGAMGIVYDGFDPMIGRRVALKTVRRDQLDRAEVEEILARFKREAQAAGRLSHPNIVSIYEYGEDNGTAFIAMECRSTNTERSLAPPAKPRAARPSSPWSSSKGAS